MKCRMRKLVPLLLMGILWMMNVNLWAKTNSIDLYMDYQKVDIPKSEGEIYIDGAGKIRIPVKFIANYFGFKTQWYPEYNNFVILDKEYDNMNRSVIHVDQLDMYAPDSMKSAGNGIVMLATSPRMKDGVIYVTSEILSELFYRHVQYKVVDGKRSVYVTTYSKRWHKEVEPYIGFDPKVIEYRPQDVPTYKLMPGDPMYNPDVIHWLSSKIGSNEHNTQVRDLDNPLTIYEEIGPSGYLGNFMLKNIWQFGWSLNGKLWPKAIKALEGDPLHEYNNIHYKVSSEDPTMREIVLGPWCKPWYDLEFFGFGDIYYTIPQNIIIEALKYCSHTPEDGKAIYAYIDKCAVTSQNPVFDQVITFGETKVKFYDPGKYGIGVIFVR